MTLEDRRIRSTKTALKNELLKQMLDRKYTDLNVKELCENSDISRRTFYLHYRDIDDVFRDIFAEINRPLYEGIEALEKNENGMGDNSTALGEIFRLINLTIRNYTDYLRRIAVEPTYSGVQARHITLMKKLIRSHLGTGSEICRIYLDYYVTGILEQYFQWYRNETSLTLEDIREFALGIYEADQNGFLMNFERNRIKEI